MPQLIPDPWLYIFIMIWLVFILILPSKINNYKMLYKPTPKKTDMYQLLWLWPWI
uniref:ATP synthase complex subunit 8 n=1 Tax=Hyperolius ocellatus TaxID=191618 RepID=S4V1P8_HYPOE|nr:ATP synthase F0 subunit 8 [Hyperolius ocellatus]